MTFRRRAIHAVRRFHLYLGLGAALYFMLIAATGVALNHRQGFRLEDRYISRSWLPSSYRAQDGKEVRADIVIGDLHSGLIFGRVGAPVMDVVATVWFLSLGSGISLAILSRTGRNGASAGRISDEDANNAETIELSAPTVPRVEQENSSRKYAI